MLGDDKLMDNFARALDFALAREGGKQDHMRPIRYVRNLIQLRHNMLEMVMAFRGKHTDEIKARIAEASRRLWEDPAHRERFSASMKGRTKTKAQRDQFCEAQKQDYSYLDEIPAVALAYAAGIVDGEGSVYITKRSGRTTYQLHLSVVNTNREVIDWFYDTFRGYWRGQDLAYKGWKQKWIWTTAHTHAGAVLDRLFPYMIIKKKQVVLAQQFLAERTGPADRLEELRLRMGSLNKRGIEL